MTRKSFMLAVVLLCAGKLAALDFEFSAGGGISTGTVREYVFEDDYTLSRIDWNGALVPEIRLDGRIEFFGAVVDARIISAVPVCAGTVQDYDWEGADKSRNTKFSTHSLYMNKLFDVQLKTGYEFSAGNFTLAPLAGCVYRNQKFEANGGYGQYPVSGYWTEDEERQYFSGTILTYETSVFLPFLEFRAACPFAGRWNVLVYGRVYPYIISDTLDCHYTRSVQFFDSERGGFGFLAGAEIGFMNLAFGFEYEYFVCHGGTTKCGRIGWAQTPYLQSSASGIDSSVLSFFLMYRF